MFSSLAWMRAFTLLFLTFASRSYAREETLFTSSVTYCNPPETLLIQRFEVAYFAKNQSVAFNISAASVQPNINVTANLFLNFYGMNPLNITIDLCSILGGALCPLPMYNFTGADSISLPDSLGINGRIPGIAFKIPDLEGFAQLTLTEVHTGTVKACVQATLSNGWTAHQPAVEWATAGVTLAALLSAIWQSVWPDSLAPFRLLDLLYLLQTIASSAFLSLNYSSVYRAYALNFAWAVGLISSSDSSMQAAIDRMRHRTGGNLADSTSGSAVGLVNRKLSPYNAGTTNLAIVPYGVVSRATPSNLLDTFLNLDIPVVAKLQSLARRATSSADQSEVQTVTNSSSNILQAGVPIYTNSVHVATANAFMTAFLVALIMKGYSASAFDYPSFMRAWVLRLAFAAFSPLLIFILYQWTLKDSWLSVLLSVITFLTLLAVIFYSSFLTSRVAVRSSHDELYSPSYSHMASYGPLYSQYRPPRYFFFFIPIIASTLRAIFIAFARSNGLVQIILIVIVEVAVVALHLILRPHKTRGGDVFSTFLAIVRLVCMGLMIAFIQSLNLKPIPRVVIGIIIAVIFSVAILVVIVNLILHTGITLIWRSKRGPSATSSHGSEGSVMEKGGKEKDLATATSWEHDTSRRAINPTPDQNIPLDPQVLEPYPISPTGTTISTMEPPSKVVLFTFATHLTYGTSTASHGQRDSQRTSSALHSPMYSVAEGIEDNESSAGAGLRPPQGSQPPSSYQPPSRIQ
ncbi:hypothetical protein BDQ17DRAFT_1421003 [Cyathus striatus]|nr:hypothetical protein BDQ17DRAFT_1421003 [Cyathus striatus]